MLAEYCNRAGRSQIRACSRKARNHPYVKYLCTVQLGIHNICSLYVRSFTLVNSHRGLGPHEAELRQPRSPLRCHLIAGLATVELPLEPPLHHDPPAEPWVLGPALRHAAVAVRLLVRRKPRELCLPLAAGPDPSCRSRRPSSVRGRGVPAGSGTRSCSARAQLVPCSSPRLAQGGAVGGAGCDL